MAWLPDLWALAKKVDGLAGLEKRHGELIAGLADKLQALEKRVQQLENREDIVVMEAKAAARAGATDAMSGHVLDIGGRLTKLEATSLTIESAGPRRRVGKPKG